jgi:hypothetical protein
MSNQSNPFNLPQHALDLISRSPYFQGAYFEDINVELPNSYIIKLGYMKTPDGTKVYAIVEHYGSVMGTSNAGFSKDLAIDEGKKIIQERIKKTENQYQEILKLQQTDDYKNFSSH